MFFAERHLVHVVAIFSVSDMVQSLGPTPLARHGADDAGKLTKSRLVLRQIHSSSLQATPRSAPKDSISAMNSDISGTVRARERRLFFPPTPPRGAHPIWASLCLRFPPWRRRLPTPSSFHFPP